MSAEGPGLGAGRKALGERGVPAHVPQAQTPLEVAGTFPPPSRRRERRLGEAKRAAGDHAGDADLAREHETDHLGAPTEELPRVDPHHVDVRPRAEDDDVGDLARDLLHQELERLPAVETIGVGVDCVGVDSELGETEECHFRLALLRAAGVRGSASRVDRGVGEAAEPQVSEPLEEVLTVARGDQGGIHRDAVEHEDCCRVQGSPLRAGGVIPRRVSVQNLHIKNNRPEKGRLFFMLRCALHALRACDRFL